LKSLLDSSKERTYDGTLPQLEAIMSPVREQFLTLVEIEGMLHKFEQKYGMSTTEFLTNPERHAQMLDDDVFQWEAFHAHRDELERVAEEVRSAYLGSVKKCADQTRAANNNLALAA
jgi:hypothetical protein